MDIPILLIARKILSKWWVLVLCTAIGLGIGYNYTRSFRQSYSVQTTLIGINQDIRMEMYDIYSDLTISRRIATELLGVFYSNRVAEDAATRLYSEYGINLPPQYISAIIMPSTAANSNIITLRVTSSRKEDVVPVANTVRDAFVTAVQGMTSTSYFQVLDEAKTNQIGTSLGGNKKLYYLAGAGIGFMLGLAGLYFLTLFATRIKMVEDVVGLHGVSNVIPIPLHNIK